MRSLVLSWFPLAFVVTILCGLVEVSVQQDMRQTANDVPAQWVQRAVDQMGLGASAAQVVGTAKVDIGTSLDPFLMVINEDNVTTDAILDGTPLLSPPHGVLLAAQAHGENRITWQPRPGVRQAIVTRYVKGPSPLYILAGQSLLETEKHEARLQWQVLAAWVAALAGSFFLASVIRRS